MKIHHCGGRFCCFDFAFTHNFNEIASLGVSQFHFCTYFQWNRNIYRCQIRGRWIRRNPGARDPGQRNPQSKNSGSERLWEPRRTECHKYIDVESYNDRHQEIQICIPRLKFKWNCYGATWAVLAPCHDLICCTLMGRPQIVPLWVDHKMKILWSHLSQFGYMRFAGKHQDAFLF